MDKNISKGMTDVNRLTNGQLHELNPIWHAACDKIHEM